MVLAAALVYGQDNGQAILMLDHLLYSQTLHAQLQDPH